MGLLILLIPLVTALLCWVFNDRKILHGINVLGSLFLLGNALWITARVQSEGVLTYPLFDHFFYLDCLNALILDTTLLVGFVTCFYSIGYLDHEYGTPQDLRKIKLFYSLTYTFIFTMVLTATTQNLGLMWIAIEATTLASVFLVGFSGTKHSIEAAWKYIIICSVGIALALLGIMFLYFSSSQALTGSRLSLNWLTLYENAGKLQGNVLKMAFIFILVGFGTKAGLVPMHTWLPDAHSEAPSPISALLSGVLLNNAMYGIIRFLSIVNKNMGSSVYTGRLLIFGGLLSIGAAALFILAQKDYKRLLAYSSVEHMGIIALSLGLYTPVSLFASLFHMVNHSFTKSMLFLTAGNVMLKYKTKEIASVTGLLKTMPLSGSAFLLGILAIAGLPPFSIFSSELNIILAAFKSGHFLTGTVFVFLLALAFGSITYALLKMFYGKEPENRMPAGEVHVYGVLSICVLLLFITCTGIYLPPFLKGLLDSASRIITGV